MTAIRWLLLSILLLPFLELVAFFAVAAQIGFGWSLLLLLATSLLGLIVVRHAFDQLISPIRAVLANSNLRSLQYSGPRGFILLGGFLLLIPGFITDMAGVLILIMPLWRVLTAGKKVHADGVVDLEPEQWRHVPDRKLPPCNGSERHS